MRQVSSDQVRQPARNGAAAVGGGQKLGSLDGLWSAGHHTPTGQDHGHLEGEPRAKQVHLQPTPGSPRSTPAGAAGPACKNGRRQGSTGAAHSEEDARRGTNGVDVHALESGKEASGAQGGQRKGSGPIADEGSHQAQCHSEIPCPRRGQGRQARSHDVRADSLPGCRSPAQHQQSAAGPHGVRGHHAHRCTDPPGEESQATAEGPTAGHRRNEEALRPSRQSIFTSKGTLGLERLPEGVLHRDLAKNTCPGKLHHGPNTPVKHSDRGPNSGRSRSIGEWLKGTGQPAQEADAKSRSQGKSECQEKKDAVTPCQLQHHHCVLENPSNLCYLNSMVQALLHSFGQVKATDRAGFGSLRPMLNALTKCAKPQQLSRRSDCMKLLQGWQGLHQQHDAAELLQHLTKDGVPRILAGRWESRVSGVSEHEPAIVRAWNTAVPLIPLPCTGQATTQLALNSWTAQPGPRHEAYVTALAEAPEILSVQLLPVLHSWEFR